MAAIPNLPSPKRPAKGVHNTVRRWKQQTITIFTKNVTYKPSQRQRSKNEGRLIIHEINNISKASKRQKRDIN